MSANMISAPVDRITVSPWNPRQPQLSEPEVVDLAASIRRDGQLTAGIARPHPTKEGYYELAVGARRRAALLLIQSHDLEGGTLAPAEMLIRVREMDDREFLLTLGVEQLQHAAWTPLQEAHYLETLRDTLPEDERTERDLAALVEKPRARVHRRLSLLSLPPAVQGLLEQGEFKLDVAYEIAALPEDLRDQAGADIEAAGADVAAAEAVSMLRDRYRPELAARQFMERAEADGERRMDPEQAAKEVFDCNGDLVPGSPWVDLSARPEPEELKNPAGKRPSFEKILGGRAVGVFRAVHPPTFRRLRLVRREVVLAADASNPKPILKPLPTSAPEAEHAAGRSRTEAAAVQARANALAIFEALTAEGSPEFDFREILADLLRLLASELSQDAHDWLIDKLAADLDAIADAACEDEHFAAKAATMAFLALALREHPPHSANLAAGLEHFADKIGAKGCKFVTG